MTTVGYGDVSGTTTWERVYVILLMLVGVYSFTYISGALASIIQNVDTEQAVYQEKIIFLNRLQMQYKIRGKLYNEVRKALNYDNKTILAGMDEFIDSLPAHLN